MRRLLPLVLVLPLVACGGGGGGTSGTVGAPAPRAVALSDGICPSPDPVRDGPLVDAIRNKNARAVQAVLARNPDDTRAQAALAIIRGSGAPDPAEAACFAPYF